jgi:hypothetical protein
LRLSAEPLQDFAKQKKHTTMKLWEKEYQQTKKINSIVGNDRELIGLAKYDALGSDSPCKMLGKHWFVIYSETNS